MKKYYDFIQFFVAIATLFAATNAAHVVSHGPNHHVVHHAPDYHAAPSYHAPLYHAAPAYHATVYHAAPVYHAPVHKEVPYADVEPHYNYQYGADDDYSGIHFAQNEKRDGYSTSGEYRVALPDCRTQIVKYNTADGYSGNIVEVTYEGAPCYPDAKAPAYKTPAPSYNAPTQSFRVLAKPVVKPSSSSKSFEPIFRKDA